MENKWMNCLVLTLFLFLLNHVDSATVQFSAQLPSELLNSRHQDLWHPHLKRKWLDEKNYVMIDMRRKIYQTSLIQLESDGGFLSDDETRPKMQCGCRFIKQDVVNRSSGGDIAHRGASFLEIKSSDEGNFSNNEVKPVNSYFEHLEENLKENNKIMSKIEHFLENQQIMKSQIGVGMNMNGMMNNMGNMNTNMGMMNNMGNMNTNMGMMNNMGNMNTNMGMNPYMMNSLNYNPSLMMNSAQMPMMTNMYQQQAFNNVNNPQAQLMANTLANTNAFNGLAFR